MGSDVGASRFEETDVMLTGAGTFGEEKVNVDAGCSRELTLSLDSVTGSWTLELFWLLLTDDSEQDFDGDPNFVVEGEYESMGS